MKSFREFIQEEDGVAANCAGGGNIAGIGVGPNGEPGVKKGKKKKVVLDGMQRRLPVS